MRAAVIKFYLSFTTPSAEDLEFISARLSVAKMRRYHNMTKEQWAAIRASMINELYCKCPDAEVCGRATTWEDCFLYEEFDQTLYLYYNVKKNTYCLTRKIV